LLIFTGGCCGSTRKRTIVGGWAWAWWLVTDVQKLSLEVMTLNPMCEMVETAQGVALTVTGVAQVKIMKVILTERDGIMFLASFQIFRTFFIVISLNSTFYTILYHKNLVHASIVSRSTLNQSNGSNTQQKPP